MQNRYIRVDYFQKSRHGATARGIRDVIGSIAPVQEGPYFLLLPSDNPGVIYLRCAFFRFWPLSPLVHLSAFDGISESGNTANSHRLGFVSDHWSSIYSIYSGKHFCQYISNHRLHTE